MSLCHGARAYIGRWVWAGIAGSALLCAACEDAPVTTVSHRVDDVRSFVIGVMKEGPLLIVSQGQPFDAPDEQITLGAVDAVRSSMSWTAQPRLTADPSRSASTALYLQLVYNDPTTKPCGGRGAGGPPQMNGRVEIVISLCSKEQSLSTVRGSIGRSDGPADARFVKLIRQATDDLLADEHHN